MRTRARSISIGAFLSLLLLAGSAGALGFSPNPVPLSGDVTGSITISSTTGLPAGATQLTGTTAAADVTLVFQLSVSAGAVEILGVSGITLPFTGIVPTGTGWIPGAGVDIAGVDATVATAPQFDFGVSGTPMAGEGVGAGQTSDLFFVSYAALVDDSTQAVNFMVDPGAGGTFNVMATIVPEPSTLTLLGTGVVLAAIGRSRRREG